MNNNLLITCEILLAVVTPLLILYLKGRWPLRVIVPCLLTIPVLWYLTYALLHELSHVAATYLVGGEVIDHKLVPKFWAGETGHAWIKSSGIIQGWQQLVTSASPYILDDVCIIVGLFILRQGFSRNAFLLGLVFTLLCLRPAFDFVCESIAFAGGDKGDFYAMQLLTGRFAIWSFISCSLALSVFSIVTIVRRFVGAQEPLPVMGNT